MSESGQAHRPELVCLRPAVLAELSLEAERIALALVDESATPCERERYARAIEHLAIPLSGSSAGLWSIMLRRPRLFAVLDAGLAFVDPRGPIRQRVFIMLAILEASPDHVNHFLPADDGRLPVSELVLGSVMAVLRALIGVPLVLVLHRESS